MKKHAGSRLLRVRREFISGMVLILSLGLLIASYAPLIDAIRPIYLKGLGSAGAAPRHLLVTAFCLNLALLIFSWRCYRDVRQMESAANSPERRRRRADVTGLPDLSAFEAEATGLIRHCALGSGEVIMLALKLDRYGSVADVHGRETADALLQAAAKAIAATAPRGCVIGHAGGDEFALAFACPASDRQRIATMVRQFARDADWLLPAGGKELHTACTFGAATTLGETLDYHELRRRALLAMRFAMRRGAGQSAFYASDMDMEVRSRSAVEDAMRAGLVTGEFQPFFERQIDLATGRLVGFEVLTRWLHESYGSIPVERVIDIAEQAGLIEQLSHVVFTTAFTEARNWDPAISLSVNISPFQMRDPWLAEKLIQLLQETGFPASRLEVEITESALVEDFELARNLLNSLKNQGIRLALDDFGTGYSSLQHLRSLPFDRLKIDKSFVQTIDQSPKALTLATSIAALADSLDLPTTAEGVETPQILEHLKEMGCEKGQGWHFGRPMPAEEARKLARAQLRVVGGWAHARKTA